MKKDRIRTELLIHDLKVPLSVIRATIESLLHRQQTLGPLTPKQEKALLRAQRNIRLSQTLVGDALEIARSTWGFVRFTPLRLSGFVRNSLIEVYDLIDPELSEQISKSGSLGDLTRVLKAKRAILAVEDGDWEKEIRIDPAKTTQIFRNLLTNGLKYRKERLVIGLSVKADGLLLQVSDDGIGIPKAFHEKIFEQYFQLAPEESHLRGHGLGLAGVLALVEDLSGELTLKSDEGAGAQFMVRVPLAQAQDPDRFSENPRAG